MRKLLYVSFLLFCIKINAQNPTPALPQSQNTLILNATAHLGNGEIIPNAAIGFRSGKLSIVGDATRIRIDKAEYPVVIDASGKHIYPGFIECNSALGLTEIDLVRSTHDFYEVGEMNPNVRSIIAYNTDSKIIPTVRSNGVLLSQIVPEGGIISGQSSVVELDGWNWEDAAYKQDEGIHVYWPHMFVVLNNPNETEEIQKQKNQNTLNMLENFLWNAKAYSMNSNQEEKNLKFESMRGLFNGRKKLYIHCEYVKEIVNAINMTGKLGVKIVLVGGMDSYLVADLLKSENIPVILGRIHSLPPREDADYDLPYKLPYLLKQSGVSFAISVEGSWQNRNLAFNAGTAVGYGLSKEEALTSITLTPAKILGIDSKVGSLEVGKDATLFISDGDALDMRTNNVTRAFIEGKEINLDNVQKQLYRKYLNKYEIKN